LESDLGFDANPLCVCTSTDDEGFGKNGAAIIGFDGEWPLGKVNALDGVDADFGAYADGLFAHRIHELRPFDGVCKAWEVFDFGGDGELPAGLEAFEDEGG
jgi:hypothetical protein